MKRKGFTLVELLVVIAIIALLMGVLMPALARVRQIAYRMICGTNLSGIGKAMVLYSNDNDEEYPVAGGKKAVWPTTGPGKISDWDHPDEWTAFGISKGGEGAKATITSSFFLLVKYADVSTKQFVCKGDSGATAFQLTDATTITTITDVTDAWDFGDEPGKYCSYSYHMPYYMPGGSYAIYVGSRPGSPIIADRNPWFDKNARTGDTTLAAPTCTGAGIFSDLENKWNASAHQFDTQNVLYNDIHVVQAKRCNVGIENDNIWRYWPGTPGTVPSVCGKQMGHATNPTYGDGPLSADDAFLVNEGQVY